MAPAVVSMTCPRKATSSPSSATVSAQPAPARPVMATWVWDEASVLQAEQRQRLLAFVRAKSVDLLFVHASPTLEQDPGFEAFASLVEAASLQGAQVTLVAGDPTWIFPAHHVEATAFLERTRRLSDRLTARKLPSTPRVLFDVEPYLLSEWKRTPARTAKMYAELLQVLQETSRRVELEIWHTIPFWFASYEMEGRLLGETVLGRASGVVVMTYRNHAGEVASLAAPILRGADRLQRPVIVAVETAFIDPPHARFCGRTAADFADALRDIARAIGSSPAFAGLAVHKYSSWAMMLPDPVS
jgi:hypothetical protein